jgi:hypothetical protein
VSLSTADSSHRRPVSAGTSVDSHCAQGCDKSAFYFAQLGSGFKALTTTKVKLGDSMGFLYSLLRSVFISRILFFITVLSVQECAFVCDILCL